MRKVTYMTKEGYEKLLKELEELKTNGRRQVAKAIAEAREKGDLSENAEYDAAKDAQGMLELRINQLQQTIANARIIDTSRLDLSKVNILSKVTIRNTKNGKEFCYQLVSEAEADFKAKKISIASPIGKALLGHKVGDIVKVQTPGGLIEYEIVDIQFE